MASSPITERAGATRRVPLREAKEIHPLLHLWGQGVKAEMFLRQWTKESGGEVLLLPRVTYPPSFTVPTARTTRNHTNDPGGGGQKTCTADPGSVNTMI